MNSPATTANARSRPVLNTTFMRSSELLGIKM
jgi:hypothetical protein